MQAPFLVLNVTFQLISDATAAKIVMLFGYGVSVTVLYFPITYIVSDVITEVYGYAEARTILWYTIVASVLAGLVYQLAVAVPAAPFFEGGDAYATVFGIVPRVLVGGWLTVFAGDISNNYVLAKLKVRTNGRFLWLRTISSTVVGQFVNTAIFYVVALAGVLPADALVEGILAGWIMKTCVEAVFTPLTYGIVSAVKKVEGVDFYDRETNFNPFAVGSSGRFPGAGRRAMVRPALGRVRGPGLWQSTKSVQLS
ncbi:MAG: queuosine precursor transporter [Acidobacteria bacterium]|nr:queuosine precursor transporter [Acidobacteriota bacterium]